MSANWQTADTISGIYMPAGFHLYKLYKISCLYEHYKNSYKNNIDLWYDKGSSVSDFTEDEKNEMILIGSKLCRRFISQCTN